MVKLLAMHCSCYELEISREKVFVAILRPGKFSTFKLLGYAVPDISQLATGYAFLHHAPTH